MSPVWMQYDEPSTQRPSVPQRPEQQSPFAVHVLFAVMHVAPGEVGWQVPPVQLPEQQSLPTTGHAAPSVRHCVLPHWPEMQEPVQQSVLPTQAAPAGAHVAIDEAHVPATVLQTPEQHALPSLQAPPYAAQFTLAAPSAPNAPFASAVLVVPSRLAAPSGPSPPLPSAGLAEPSPGAPSFVEASACGPGALGASTPHASAAVLTAVSVTQTKRFITSPFPIKRFPFERTLVAAPAAPKL
jgi:hypothetical protein